MIQLILWGLHSTLPAVNVEARHATKRYSRIIILDALSKQDHKKVVASIIGRDLKPPYPIGVATKTYPRRYMVPLFDYLVEINEYQRACRSKYKFLGTTVPILVYFGGNSLNPSQVENTTISNSTTRLDAWLEHLKSLFQAKLYSIEAKLT